MQDLNSNSFEFNSNGFALGLDKRKVQKCSDFWWSSGKWQKNYWQGWRPRIAITMAWDILQVCFGDFRNNEIFNIAP